MSLLEDALRRHGAEAGRDSRAAAPSPAQPAAPVAPAPAVPASVPTPASPPASISTEPSAFVIAPAPAPAAASPEAPPAGAKLAPAAGAPLEEAPPATGSAPFAVRRTLVSHVLPVVVLLLIMAVAWLALQQGQRRAAEVSPSGKAAEAPPPATDGTALHPATPARHEGYAKPGATAAEADGTPTVDAAAAAGKTIIEAAKDAVPDAMADATGLPHATGDAAVPRLDSVPQVGSATSPPPAAATAAMPREKQVWPLFSIRGIADGHEKIAILDTGEMLTVGDTSRTGARLTRLAPDRAWFTWKGEVKGLRKGESSDKPLQDE